MNDRGVIEQIITFMKERGILPKNIEKTSFRSLFFYNVYDNPIGQFIFYDVATGVDSNEDTALLKALVEHFERIAFKELYSRHGAFSEVSSSDGFAAFPTTSVNALSIARKNALAEAIERYVWSFWWDENTAASVRQVTLSDLDVATRELLGFMAESSKVESIFLVQPQVNNYSEYSTIILFARYKSGGFVSGGATGETFDKTIFRAASELIRHYLAMGKFKDTGMEPTTFYEKRLVYFGSGRGDSLVERRLKNKSGFSVELPNLSVDRPVDYSYSGVVAVHHCRFEGQHPFVGGELERLCL